MIEGPVRLSPGKLLLSKWTAVAPTRREKHFLVSRVLPATIEGGPIEFVELEAVRSKRVAVVPWRALTDPSVWCRGWR